MGSAMRLAPRLLRLIVGLPIVASPATALLTSTSSTAADNAAATSAQGSFRTLTPVPRAAVPRWTDRAALEQASASDPIVDPAVELAAWSNHSRPAVNAAASRAISATPQGRETAPGRKGPMFRGYELQLPTTLFGRRKAKPAATHAANAQRMAQRQPSSGQTRLPFQRTSAATTHAATPSQRSMLNNASPTTPPASRYHGGQPIQAMHSAMDNSAGLRPVPPASQVTGPVPTPYTQPAVAKEPAAPTEDANSPARKLAAQAHEWSASAETDVEFTRIIETCRRAGASQPGPSVEKYVNELTAWALNRRGQLKADAGQAREAMLDFDDALRADPKCWRASHNRGMLLAQAGRFEKAFDDFSRTIEINPEFAKAYSNRAALLVVAGKLSGALADYGRAVDLDPNLAIAHRGRGRVCHLLGRLDDAIEHYDAAVQLAPEDAYAIASRADLLTDMGRYVDADDDYNRAIEIDPESAHAYSGSAWLLATCPESSIRNPELAMERARTAMELSGKQDALCFDTLAAAQASAGDFDAATKSVRQAIELASTDERDVYRDRLAMYQHAKPYRIAPVRQVTQASYEE
jgi:tetratricopeptide (TPR) repeat protein